jgi:FKBP-type peptidyl-prolyl cis-trans isomerase
MTKVHERAAALVLAATLLFTSVGVSVYVIWQLVSQKDSSTATTTNQPKENKLEGTKLANFTPLTTVTAVTSTDIQVGTGEEVKPGATVTAHYTGAVAKDGTIFQSSHDQPGDQPVEFGLDQVIKGWGEGVPGMKVGGVRRLVIPADKAYGDHPPAASIPVNADLVFDIELAAVKNK